MNAPTTLALALLTGALVWLFQRQGRALERARLLIDCVAGAGHGRKSAGALISRGRAFGQGPSAEMVTLVRRGLRVVNSRMRSGIVALPLGASAAVLLDSLVPLIAGVVAVPVMRHRSLRRLAERAVKRRKTGVIGFCAALSAEIRTGRPPNVALVESLGEASGLADAEMRALLGRVLAAARFGGDVPAALRVASRVPGAEGLAGIAACWQVGLDSGAGLAGGLDRVVGSLRAEEEQGEDLRAQLAGPRSTAVLLAMLPAFGVLLGTALGAGPLRVLLHTTPGLTCLGLGGALEWAGLIWTARIVRGAS